MTTVVFLLEEPSARALLEGLVPRLLGDGVEARYVVFEGKQDLEAQVTRKLRGWRRPDSKFVVLRDQDAGDCHAVKQRLGELVAESGRTALICVACRELEAWVVGDLGAVSRAFEDPSVAGQANKAKFRDPDRLHKPVDELRRLVPQYQKIDGARRLGPLLEPGTNASRSFRFFCAGLERLAGGDA